MSKRWQTTIWPSAVSRRHTSKIDAYRFVQRVGKERALGMNRIESVTVKVSEDKGPWMTYERVRFPAPEATA